MARPPRDPNSPELQIDPRGGLRSLGATAVRLTAGLADRRGWTAARLMAHWPEIVGEALARRSLPERLVNQGRGTDAAPAAASRRADEAPPRRPAALRIRVSGSAALEFQHRQVEIIERINGYFGYRAIDRLQLVQGTVPAPAPRRVQPPLDQVRTRAIAAKVSGIRNESLRAALERLGQSIERGRRR